MHYTQFIKEHTYSTDDENFRIAAQKKILMEIGLRSKSD